MPTETLSLEASPMKFVHINKFTELILPDINEGGNNNYDKTRSEGGSSTGNIGGGEVLFRFIE